MSCKAAIIKLVTIGQVPWLIDTMRLEAEINTSAASQEDEQQEVGQEMSPCTGTLTSSWGCDTHEWQWVVHSGWDVNRRKSFCAQFFEKTPYGNFRQCEYYGNGGFFFTATGACQSVHSHCSVPQCQGVYAGSVWGCTNTKWKDRDPEDIDNRKLSCESLYDYDHWTKLSHQCKYRAHDVGSGGECTSANDKLCIYPQQAEAAAPAGQSGGEGAPASSLVQEAESTKEVQSENAKTTMDDAKMEEHDMEQDVQMSQVKGKHAKTVKVKEHDPIVKLSTLEEKEEVDVLEKEMVDEQGQTEVSAS
eukprot:TRINITY_DN6006_c0_g1_i1.p1 TRINITY_DN6006_c0_g1~~TRINITY_DN6006_c0_g1_i1.p1  ORF type:complete len:304 (-),score=52.17 TRINITY_DN6006_c0_g1_i1:74-985(-)